MDKKPSFKQLEYFLAVAETLNFRHAASKLDISQPTLTTQLKALEETLNLPLLERSRTGTQLSPQGRELLPNVKKVLQSMTECMELADLLANGPATTFRIGVPPTLGPYLLPYVLPKLHQSYDKLKLYVKEATPKLLESRLLSGEFDLIILPLPVSSGELSIEPLFSEPLKLVVPSDIELSKKQRVSPEDIRNVKVLTLEEHHHFHKQVRDICQSIGAEVLSDYEGTSLDTLRQMVLMGLGVAFLPGLYVHSELHHPQALSVLELEDMPSTREHAMVWRNTAANRVFYRKLANNIKAIVAEELAGIVVPL